jgi:REP element-mobilizing transposase RayT
VGVNTHGKDYDKTGSDAPGGVRQSSDSARAMSTFIQIFYHIVFSTKGREPVLLAAGRETMFRYIWGLIRARDSHLYRVNGTRDHVHILTACIPLNHWQIL